MTQPIGVVDGTFAGTDPHAVYALQLAEIGPPHIPTLAELPAVGPRATGLGKVVASMGVPFDLRPYGWQLQRGQRITAVDQLRAVSHRDSVIQALVDVAEDTHLPEVAVRLLGPVETIVSGMLPSGQRILRDPGARADIAAAWADAVEHLTSRIRDVVGAKTTVIVQDHIAEHAVQGKIRSVSGADVERALDVNEVRAMWQLAADTDATVYIETAEGLAGTAAEVGSVVLKWPTGRNQRTEQTWEMVDGLVSAQTPVALQLPRGTDPERFAEELIQQYLDWGLEPVGLEHVRLVQQFHAESDMVVGRGLEWLRTVADHAAGYITTV